MKTLKKTIPSLISFIFVVLFAYAAIMKGAGFSDYLSKLKQSPGLPGYAQTVAYCVIILQTITVILLCYRPFRLWGLCSAFGLLAVFAGYIGTILIYSNNLPCTCIGLFEKLSWKANLVLTTVLMMAALSGIYMMRKEKKQI